MRRFLWIICWLAGALQVSAQQDPMYSQYMFNQMVINPAYAGSREYLSSVISVRKQWSGIDGAPQTGSFTAHAPTVDLKHGYGITVVADEVGLTNNTRAVAAYAYRTKLGPGQFAMGLQMGADFYRVGLSQAQTYEPGDVSFIDGDFRRTHFVAGTGLWFNTENMYLGLSVPNVLPNRLYDDFYPDLEARKYGHVFLTGGVVFDLGSHVKAKPSFLLRKTSGAPFGADLSLNLLFLEKVWAGASWRIQSDYVFMLELQLTRQIRMGYSYDYVISPLAGWAGPSHELVLGLDMDFIKRKMESPRLF